MRERPILFSAAMVRAILDGRKTQTRRVVKPQYVQGPWSVRPSAAPQFAGHSHDWWLPDATMPAAAFPKCPYGRSGDRLWVRETLSATHLGLEYAADSAAVAGEHADALNDRYARNPPFELEPRSIPAIHMPRWASRILLEIADVRVERLQNISEADAIAEGWPKEIDPGVHTGGSGDPLDWYHGLWESINGPGSWERNPWVWAVEFQQVATTPTDAVFSCADNHP